MNRYDVREELGDGTFGTVYRAYNIETREEVSFLFSLEHRKPTKAISLILSHSTVILDQTVNGSVLSVFCRLEPDALTGALPCKFSLTRMEAKRLQESHSHLDIY